MGIVFGDIGASPPYTLQIAVKSAGPDGAISSAAVLGIVSLIFWSLIIVSHEIGQIYVPLVNWLLAFGTLAAVVGFGSSDALAGAFGIAVSLLMAITTIWATFVASQWKHNPFLVLAVNGSLLALDLLFVASTSTKLFEGGWFPLAISFIVAFLMMTWRRGQEILDQVRLEIREKSQEFIARIKTEPPMLFRVLPSFLDA